MPRAIACLAAAGLLAAVGALASPAGKPPPKPAVKPTTRLAIKPTIKPTAKRPLPRPATPKVSKGAMPTFEAEGYMLTLTTMETRSKLELAERGAREHSIEMEGRITAPEGEDAIAVTKKLDVATATDGDDRNLLESAAPARPSGSSSAVRPVRTTSEYRADTFAAFQGGSADIDVPTADLRRSPYTIQKMGLKATAIVGEEREEKTLPAVVMENYAELMDGLRVRITGLKVAANRQFTVTADCQRSTGGPSGPFVEQLWLLDEKGRKLAGGRWTRGDPFGKAGGLTWEMVLSKDDAHKSILFVLCTKYARKHLTFEVEGIFQEGSAPASGSTRPAAGQ